MQPEFEDFIAKWRVIAMQSGSFELPSRGAITAGGFAQYLPGMMIAQWDLDYTAPQTRYIGSQIEAAWRQDPSQQSFAVIFKDPAAAKMHVEIARAVTSKHIAALVEAELVFDDHLVLPIAQLRLPLAPEDGQPMIMSLFSFPETASGPSARMPKLENLRSRFIELIPADKLAAVV